jgi:hypothetical protein
MSTTLQYSNMNNAEAFQSLLSDAISFGLAGDNVLVPGVTKKRIMCYRIFLVVADATNLTFKNGPNTNLSGAIPMVANGSLVLDISNVPWFQTTSGNDFILGSSGSVQVSGMVYYQQN